MMTKASVHQEDMISQTCYTPDNKDSKYLQKNLKESQDKIEKDSKYIMQYF